MPFSERVSKQFGRGDPPVARLPSDFRECVLASAAKSSSAACDAAVGSRVAGFGFCAQPEYADSTYCACVNADLQKPQCVFRPCADSLQAFKPTAMQTKTLCPSTINCASVRGMGGETNVAAGVQAPSNCYGPSFWLLEYLSTIVIFLIIALVLGALLAARRRRRPPPAVNV